MKKYILWFVIILVINLILGGIMYFFLFPKLSTSHFFVKYQLGHNDEKTIIINKTEKITVKEDFSLAKITEKVTPAITRIYFIPKIKSKIDKLKIDIYSSTGVILSSDGILVTILPEASLVDKDIKVFLADGRSFVAEIEKEDEFNEILFLKISADNLPVAPFGESDKLQNGEKVVLSGRAISTEDTIFSLKTIQEHKNTFNKNGTELLFSDKNSEVFIIDGPIDSQFLGGPAIDFNGTIIGLINYTKNISEQTSFIIPFENIKRVLNHISSDDVSDHTKLGIYYLNIDKKLNLLNDLPTEKGALVYSSSGKNGLAILANSLGKKAGIKIGDIITHINGIEINSDNSLSKILSESESKEDMVLKILREGKELEIGTALKE